MSEQPVYAGLEPAEVWRHFGALNAIPRPSRREQQAIDYVLQIAAAAGAAAEVDPRGNAIVRVPATPGREGHPTVAIQAHLDMVCEKRPEVEHDFETDPILPRRDGDRIYASGTTLGADNGIGAAMALAALTDPTVEHGPLELLFTVEEEIGLNGAAALRPEDVSARLLINLDSEDPKEITVGCAGGGGVVFTLPVTREPAPEGWEGRQLTVAGLKGGHSGVQIHERLANAIKLLVDALHTATERHLPFRLSAVSGGNAHNAIPRDASALLAAPSDQLTALSEAVDDTLSHLRDEWHDDEPDLEIRLLALPAADPVLTQAQHDALFSLLLELPHGVREMSSDFPGKVETSTNLAMLRTEADAITIATSSRSFVNEELDRLQEAIRARGEAAGATADLREGYGPWEPDPHSRLAKVAEQVYAEVFGHSAEVQVIHAGLECGVIVSHLPGMEAVSFGPLIRGAHTPEEHVYISTVESSWKLLAALLRAL